MKLPGHLGLFAKLICWTRNLVTRGPRS
jgi:hypothetical protein